MTAIELQIQEKLSIVLEALNQELPIVTSRERGYGWALRGAYRTYINSNYQNPEKLQAASTTWRKTNLQRLLLEWLINLIGKHYINDCLTDYNGIISDIDDMIEISITIGEPVMTDIINQWRQKLPNPEL